MSDHKTLGEPNLWIPEQDQVKLALLGKLAEEASELAARASRCVVQGLYGEDPKDGRQNIEHLREELADVSAMINLTNARLNTCFHNEMEQRATVKFAHKNKWLKMLAEWVESRKKG